jgi:hypothetical protein
VIQRPGGSCKKGIRDDTILDAETHVNLCRPTALQTEMQAKRVVEFVDHCRR